MLNEGLEMIKQGAFQGCMLLETVSLPSTLSKIGNNAFHNCSRLKKMLFQGGLCSIGENAFLGCRALERFTFSSISTRLNNIIKAGYSNIEPRIDIRRGIEREDGELYIPISGGRSRRFDWPTLQRSLYLIDRLITYYESKEATVCII